MNKDYLTENRCSDKIGWISVKDKLPKECKCNGTVLSTDGGIVITAPASSVTADGVITHWQFLLEPPEAAP